MSVDLQRTDRQIMGVNTEIADAVVTLSELEHDAAMLRGQYEVQEARAFLNAEGSMDIRKRLATLATENVKRDLEIAEAKLRVHKAFMRSLEHQLDGLRSKGAMQRASWANEAAGQYT